ncbi:glutathione peroxidase [Paenibacillus glycanilyticus]|uniref:Glutathione peroxidase n=1 Tax=Paenibacillus glycanilyticus TaxID=126569 RepID=A0ABQ6NEK1_9BACL|nr:glutathione peroxidase [Paenibacillus glycanilyticus]GMK43520.1 glutathione peroxidase [Paenibacillus glycanilyticus]
MSLYNIEVNTIKGEKQTLAPYKGQVLLIVNTATKCGFAPQFKGLQKLHDTYKERGFAVLGFPSSQFMNQELENNAEIAQSCELNFGVNFPLYARIDVNGDSAHPLFQKLKKDARGILGSKRIKWNFTKFLVNKEGKVVKRFGPNVTPERIDSEIQALLSK